MEEKKDVPQILTESKRPEDSPFKQQRLYAWQPLLTPRWVISSFLVIGLVFIIIGIIVLVTSRSVIEVSKRYDNLAYCSLGSECNVTLDIPDKMSPPIYFYYSLSNFYQNHRRYVTSRSDEQLRGELSYSPSDCDPLESYEGKTLYPCGLIANSFFSDKFSACVLDNNGVCVTPLTESDSNWVKKGISWESDREVRYKAREIDIDKETRQRPPNMGAGTLPDVDDEDLIVWMRLAGLPTFKKLYRKIENLELAKGSKLQVTIANNFSVEDFGEKAIVLSTISWLGGRNDFLGWSYIVVALICILLSSFFGVSQLIWPRILGDERSIRPDNNSMKSSGFDRSS